MDELTPWELHKGVWYKREDYYRHPLGPNGSKYRLARHLVSKAAERGAHTVVSASPVPSPQAAVAGVVAADFGLRCITVFGGAKPLTIVRHESVRVAMEAGAELDLTPRSPHNPAIQKRAAQLADELGAFRFRYLVGQPWSREDVEPALALGGAQVANMPSGLRTLVLPFGSGNAAALVLYGLARAPHPDLESVVLVGIGPDKLACLWETLAKVGVGPEDLPTVRHLSLYGWFTSYKDKMAERLDDIVFHPTYEGKVVRYLNYARPDWWADPRGATGFWVVGGPLS